jgi:hypothetical protein
MLSVLKEGWLTSSTSMNSARMPAKRIRRVESGRECWETYHRLDVRMGNGVELVVLQFECRADVDVCSLVFGRVAILGCREDYFVVSIYA